MYFVKDQTEHIILTGSWFNEDPEVNPLHLIKEDGKWKLNNTEDILIGYMNGPKFLNSNKDIVFPDQGLEVGTAPYAGNHIRVASIDDENNITWIRKNDWCGFDGQINKVKSSFNDNYNGWVLLIVNVVVKDVAGYKNFEMSVGIRTYCCI